MADGAILFENLRTLARRGLTRIEARAALVQQFLPLLVRGGQIGGQFMHPLHKVRGLGGGEAIFDALILQQTGRGFAIGRGLQQPFRAFQMAGQRQANLGLQAGRRGPQGFDQAHSGHWRVDFAQQGGGLLPESGRFFGIGKDSGEGGEVGLGTERSQSFRRGSAGIGVGVWVAQKACQLWLQAGQAQRSGQFGGGQLPFVHLIGNDRG